MSIDRVGTAANSRLMMSQILKAENALNTSNRQVASGKVSNTYSGYGDKTAVMEAARSAGARADAHITTAQQASSRLDVQDAQLTQLSNIAQDVRDALTKGAADQDSTSLMEQMEGLFSQAVQVLNARDGNGYLYAGDTSQTAPVTVSKLDDLLALPSVGDAFANGQVKTTVRLGDSQTMEVGLLASDIGTQLMQLFHDVAAFNAGPSGPLGSSTTTPAGQSFLEATIKQTESVSTTVNGYAATNGIKYQMAQATITQLEASSNVYSGFVSNIEDVDMSEAIARLQQNQIALQASFQVTAGLNRLSLLDFMN